MPPVLPKVLTRWLRSDEDVIADAKASAVRLGWPRLTLLQRALTHGELTYRAKTKGISPEGIVLILELVSFFGPLLVKLITAWLDGKPDITPSAKARTAAEVVEMTLAVDPAKQ